MKEKMMNDQLKSNSPNENSDDIFLRQYIDRIQNQFFQSTTEPSISSSFSSLLPEHEISLLRNRLSDLYLQLREVESQKDTLETQLINKEQNFQAEMLQMKAITCDLDKQLESLKNERNYHRKQIESLESKVKKQKYKVQSLRVLLEQEQDRKPTATLNEGRQTYNAFQKQIQEQTRRKEEEITHLQRKLVRKKQKKQQLRGIIQREKQCLEEKNAMIHSLHAKVSDLEHICSGLKNKLETGQERIDAPSHSKYPLIDILSQKSMTTISDSPKSHPEGSSDWTIVQFQAHNTRLQCLVKQKDDMILVLNEKLVKYKKQVQELRESDRSWNSKYKKLAAQFDVEKSQHQSHKNQIQQLDQINTKFQSTIQSLVSDHEQSLQEQQKNCTTDQRQFKQTIESLQIRLIKKTDQYEHVCKEKEQLVQSLNASTLQSQQLIHQIREMDELISKLKHENLLRRDRQHLMDRQLSKVQTQYHELQSIHATREPSFQIAAKSKIGTHKEHVIIHATQPSTPSSIGKSPKKKKLVEQ